MKVLIMGVNGFIGDALATYYSNKGHNVYGIARRQSENKKNDIKIYIKNLENENITGLLEEVRPDIILHCAGSASVATSLKDPLYDFDKNIGILYKTLLSLKESGVNSRFVFLSSAAVYGNPNELPIKETHTISPISPYGLHKKVCEDICKYFHQIEKMDLLIARIFSTYGEGLKKQILWDCHKKIKKTNRLELFGTGDETRDFIHIDDLVNSIDLIVNYKNENLDIPTFNIASGKEVKIRDIAFTFASAYGLNKSKIFFNNKSKDGDPLRWKADISKITNLGFSHQVSLVEGINKYVDWVKNIEKNSKSILFVATGGKKWIGGLYYVKNMLYTITQSKNFEKYCIYILVNKESEDLFLPFENYNNVHIIFSTKGSENNIVSNLFRLLKRTIDLELLKVCHQYKIDYIFPVNKYPYMGLKDRCVFWIPDFQHIHLPHNFSKLQRYYRNLLFRYISRQKNKLILSSNDAFTDFIKFYNNSGEHSSAHVVPFTSFIDEEKNKIDEKYLMNIRKKYNLPKNFLFIGNQFWKHKNYNVALKAMNYIVNEMGGNIQLICTGNPKSYSNSDYYNELNRYIKQNNLEKNITILGFLPRLEQLAIMKLSDVIVQPSLFEGWGTVVEDAKSLSKYTIISNIKVHIEQKDNKSLIFEKNDYIDLANKIMGFMNSDKEEVTEQIANNQVKLYSDYFDKVFLAE